MPATGTAHRGGCAAYRVRKCQEGKEKMVPRRLWACGGTGRIGPRGFGPWDAADALDGPGASNCFFALQKPFVTDLASHCINNRTGYVTVLKALDVGAETFFDGAAVIVNIMLADCLRIGRAAAAPCRLIVLPVRPESTRRFSGMGYIVRHHDGSVIVITSAIRTAVAPPIEAYTANAFGASIHGKLRLFIHASIPDRSPRVLNGDVQRPA